MTTRHEFEVRSEELAAASPSGWKHTGPWICAQRWEQVLSLHWPVSHETARRLVPAALELDTYDDQAYVSLLSLRMARVHLREGLDGAWVDIVTGRRHTLAGTFDVRAALEDFPVALLAGA